MKNAIKIFAGIFIIATAIIGYHNSLEYTYQLTFLSNSLCGWIFFIDGIINCTIKKNVPIIIYQMAVQCTSVVFFTCIFTLFGWHTFNFKGAFLFLHTINPPLILVIYLFLTKLNIKDKADYFKRIFISPLLIMCYLLFDYIRFLNKGELVYGLINEESLNAVSVPLIGIGFYLLMAFMSYGLLDLKLYVQKKFDR